MSFNLNKSDSGPSDLKGKIDSKKTSFDLSKSDNGIDVDPGIDIPRAKKPAYWIYALLALLIIGAASWLLINRESAGEKPVTDTALSSGAAAVDTIAADTTMPVRPAERSHEQAIAETSPAAGASVAEQAKAENPGSMAKLNADKTAGNDTKQGKDQAMASPQTDSGLKINSAAVFAASFEPGATNPKSTVKNILASIRRKIKKDNEVKVNVFGYASSEGDLALNQSISQARADGYKKLLVRNGIAESSITATGRGIENPVASNGTESGRRQNRRVEVSF